jgi:hypothetical protein
MNADENRMNADKAMRVSSGTFAHRSKVHETLHGVHPRSSGFHLRSSAFPAVTRPSGGK